MVPNVINKLQLNTSEQRYIFYSHITSYNIYINSTNGSTNTKITLYFEHFYLQLRFVRFLSYIIININIASVVFTIITMNHITNYKFIE